MILFLPILGIIVSFLCLKFLPGPYVWISLTWVITLLLIAKKGKGKFFKVISAYTAAAVFAFGTVETYLWIQEMGSKLTIDSLTQAKYIVPNDMLGYGPVPRNQGHAVKHSHGELVYDALYGIDSNGIRISPPHRDDAEEALLFFGCSITFGEGINDSETSAYQTGRATDGRFQVYNFAFHGYGPHQILAMLQHGRVDSIVKAPPKYAVYQAITGHIPRVLGLTPWNEHDPRYIRDENGSLKYSGHFDDNSRISPKVRAYLDKCLVYRNLRLRSVNDQDVTLFIDVIDSCRTTFERKYPGSEFHIIYWSEESDEIGKKIIGEIQKRGMRVHLIESVIPDFNIPEYLLPHDGHPNPKANRAIAKYVSTRIVHPKL